MVTEKEKLIRAYIEGVQDRAGAVLTMVNEKKLTMEQMRKEAEAFGRAVAEEVVEKIMEEPLTPRAQTAG